MRLTDLDLMTEFALERLASNDRGRINALVRQMAEKWPHLPALGICFSITQAASTLESFISDQSSERSASRAYKLAALVAADVLALEAMGGRSVTGHDLLHYWQRLDPFFLKI